MDIREKNEGPEYKVATRKIDFSWKTDTTTTQVDFENALNQFYKKIESKISEIQISLSCKLSELEDGIKKILPQNCQIRSCKHKEWSNRANEIN